MFDAFTVMARQMLASRGYTEPRVEKRGREYVAIAVKGPFTAEALGYTEQDAARNLVVMVMRP